MMSRLDTIVTTESPDIMLVYGDTNSTLAAALVAVKRDVDLAHVEAGLRSRNWQMPEEVNRVLTDHCSDLLFTPSRSAVSNLRQEGITDSVFDVGDVMYDAVLKVRDRLPETAGIVERLGLDTSFVVATIHRPHNTDDPDRLTAIIEGLSSLRVPVVFPVHPRTSEALETYGLWEYADEELTVIEPLGYTDFIGLVDAATYVVTDSGGVQKEAFYLETPCITVRPETEWSETVECGWNTLASATAAAIRESVQTFERPASKPSLYGDGTASKRIVEILGAAEQS